MKNFTLGLLFLMCSMSIFGQKEDTHALDHEQEHDHHEIHHNFEFGVANSVVYFMKAKEYAHSLHLHFMYTISDTKFGFGLGYEKINDEHKHNAIGLLINYRLIPRWSITISPALSFEGNHTDEYNFALHVETGYEIELHNFHVGPVIGFAYEPEDTHISAGVHIAFGF